MSHFAFVSASRGAIIRLFAFFFIFRQKLNDVRMSGQFVERHTLTLKVYRTQTVSQLFYRDTSLAFGTVEGGVDE